MLTNFLNRLIEETKATDHNYETIIAKKGMGKPIPFFGSIETAKVLTVGVNPSGTEFDISRKWPPEGLPAENLKDRLINYFDPEKSPAEGHGWFAEWEKVLKLIGYSYFDRTACHLDISPRGTISMESVRNMGKETVFIKMLEHDIKWFFETLSFCNDAQLILVAGKVLPSQELIRFIKKHIEMSNLNFKLVKQEAGRRGGTATSSFHKLEMKKELEVFYCSSGPSYRTKPPPEIGKSSFLFWCAEENKKRLFELSR